MNELMNKKLVTTKELAEILDVDLSTIKKTVKRLETVGEVLHHSTIDKGNTVFMYDENQVTKIKQEIQKHHNLQSRHIDNVNTELELFENYKKANEQLIQFLNQKKTELELALCQEKQLNEINAPKVETYNSLVERGAYLNFRDSSKELGINQNEFMHLLTSKYIYKNSIGEYRFYSNYSKYFVLRPYFRGEKRTGQQVLLTIDGVNYFKNLVSKKMGGIQ